MRRSFLLIAPALAAVFLAAGCGGSDHDGPMMAGPSGMGPTVASASFMSVSPAGGAVGVATSTAITLRFGTGMAPGMEQYLDLHVGDLGGPTVPMHCAWSADGTLLTCTPDAPLQSHTTYWIHLGGGLMTQAGQLLDYDQYGAMMGGQWIQGGMMGSGFHAGSPWGMMGGSWQNPNGAYGMAFGFTTA